jgi:hypothetical protein
MTSVSNKFIILLAIVISIFGCNSDISQSHAVTQTEDFDVFFKKFNSDSLFQISRVKFPFKALLKYEEGDTTRYLSKKQWCFIHLVNNKKEKSIINKTQIHKGKVLISYSIEDTGILVNHYFEMIDGKWQHTYVEDESD